MKAARMSNDRAISSHPHTGIAAIVSGTGYEGRATVIRRHCRAGMAVLLRREPQNEHDSNAIAVYLKCPRLFGLLGHSEHKIGYIKARAAARIAAQIDQGVIVAGVVRSFYAPVGRDHPRVSLELHVGVVVNASNN